MTAETITTANSNARLGRERSALPVPVLDEEPGRLGHRLASLPSDGHPVWTYVCGIALAVAAIASLSILLGLLVTHVVLTSMAIAADDESFVGFLAHHRSRGLTEASLIGSIMAGGVVLPIVAGVALIVAAVARQWRVAALSALRARGRVRRPTGRRRSSSTGTVRRSTGSRSCPSTPATRQGIRRRRSRSTAASPC